VGAINLDTASAHCHHCSEKSILPLRIQAPDHKLIEQHTQYMLRISATLIVVVSSNILTCDLLELITVLQQPPELFVPSILSLNRKSHPSSCSNWPLLHSTF
jgi:hypothetical protein